MAAFGPLRRLKGGRARQLCPGISDVDFLGNLDRIVDLDAKVANGALDLRVVEQKLDRTQMVDKLLTKMYHVHSGFVFTRDPRFPCAGDGVHTTWLQVLPPCC